MLSTLSHATGSGIRRAELLAALSIATDFSMGQPMEYAMTTCVVAVRIGEAAGLLQRDLEDAYNEALLRYIGCNADTYWLASIIGDELALRAEIAAIDTADTPRIMQLMLRYIRQTNAGANLVRMTQAFIQGVAELGAVHTSFFPGHCEVAQRLAQRLGFEESFVATVGQIYARWDGRGVPALKGDAISPALLTASLAHDIVTFYKLGGIDAAVAMARKRRGRAHSPMLVDCFLRNAAQVLAGLGSDPAWETVLAMEPGSRHYLTQEELDTACGAMADFADIKSPWFLGHSHRVAELARAAAVHCGLPADDVRGIYRAALLHDIGKVGVSAAVWGKDAPLSDREVEQVRMHPYYTARILARPSGLARLGELASQHHERLDGSGYHRNLNAAALTPASRIVAAANRYMVLCEERPHRRACSADEAAQTIRNEARSGQLDAEVADSVLAAAGHRASRARRAVVGGLSERELEVLRLVARGNTMKQAAAKLFISAKTVDRHLQNIYSKIGVSTRAGATLFAMEHRLLE
ncbi:MAG TPA: HD domain-containing phosphohydrolase [Candidatus Kapabacteria bacterium]|nr:HD domain-containing phosphohydrolase [Candidatus Kapabacteria bacterium]